MTDAPRSGLPRWVEAPVAAVGLLVSAPVLLGAALGVKLTSPGPALFRQERVGLHGRPFVLLKLRSMTTGAAGPGFTAGGDLRVTRWGRVLRATKLDELPELWNILVGEMSFVGPRPEVPRYVDPGDPAWRRVLEARPGLTDPVTLRLRNEEALLASVPGDRGRFYSEHLLPWKLRGYLDYLGRRTPWSDLGVLVRTVLAVLLPSTEPPPSLLEIEGGGDGAEGRVGT